MEFKEQWIMWEPLSKLKDDFYIDYVIDSDQDGFKIIIGDNNNEKKKIHIKFKFGISSYRNTDELYAWLMQKDFLRDGSSFYRVINSKYIKWLSDISNGISTSMNPDMQHFVIFTEDSTLEILNSADPEIEFIDLP